MTGRTATRRAALRAGAVAAAGLLMAACTSGPDSTTDPSAPASTSTSPSEAGGDGNGSLYVTDWNPDGGQLTITRRVIAADGSLGPGSTLVSEEADASLFAAVFDGLDGAALTGTVADFETTELQDRAAASGAVRSRVEAPGWCAGQTDFRVCVLVDRGRVARTTPIGSDSSTPAQDASVIITSLATGTTEATYGPFTNLTMMSASSTPGEVLLFLSDKPDSAEEDTGPGRIEALDTATGSTRTLGTYPGGWSPVCAIGPDSVLGLSVDGPPVTPPAPETFWAIGPASIARIPWDGDEQVVGCSADGRFLYLQRVPQPPGETTEDTEAPNPASTLDRVTLADGSREPVLTLDPEVSAGPITR